MQNNHSRIKLLKFCLKLCLFFSFSAFLTEEEKDFIYSKYFEMKDAYKSRWGEISRKYFDIFLTAEIFQRVSKVNKIFRYELNGIIFECEYSLPDDGGNVSALLKFLPEMESTKFYSQNLKWAILTGSTDETNKDSKTCGPIFSDSEKMAVKVNLHGTKPDEVDFFSQFYEMKSEEATVSEVTRRMTIIVFANGLQTLEYSIFRDDWKKEKSENTTELLRIYQELCACVERANFDGFLHGNVCPENVALHLGPNRVRHPLIFNFDLIGTWIGDFKGYDPTLRYLKLFRAPSIESRSRKDFIQSSRLPQVLKERRVYYYSPDFREDTYALAATFEKLVVLNSEKINQNDERIKNILAVIQRRITKDPFVLENVPTTEEWTEMVEMLIFQGINGQKLAEEYILDVQPIEEPSSTREAPPQSKKMKLMTKNMTSVRKTKTRRSITVRVVMGNFLRSRHRLNLI